MTTLTAYFKVIEIDEVHLFYHIYKVMNLLYAYLFLFLDVFLEDVDTNHRSLHIIIRV